MTHEIRGPDPDGDWFVVLVDGERKNTQRINSAWSLRKSD